MRGDLTFFQGFFLSIGGGEAPAVEDPAEADASPSAVTNHSWLPPHRLWSKTASQEVAVAAANLSRQK